MELLIKVCALAVTGVFAVVMIRRNLPELSVAATLATQIVLVVTASGAIGMVTEFVYEIAESVGISEKLIIPLIKTLGISIVTKLACDVCRDCGVSSVASYIEIVGGAVAISFSMPLVHMILGWMNV